MKVKVCIARYIAGYSDGMALSSNEEFYPSKRIAKQELRKEYSSDEIDIDTDNHQFGWELVETELEFDPMKFRVSMS